VWQIGRTIEVIPTGVSSAAWSFTWTAPIDTADVGGYTFQFWCGVPETGAAGYPVDLQITVDMVMQSLPAAPTTSTPLVEAPPNPAIPETN
jgi:hypothetical protein